MYVSLPNPSNSDPKIASIGNKNLNPRQEFQQLGQDLEAGNLSAAQADFASIQKFHFNHIHHHAIASTDNTLLSQVGQALRPANASEAQQAYSLLQEGSQAIPDGNSLFASLASSPGNSFSLTA